MHAFMGDFEMFYFSAKERRDLLPPVARIASEQYFNRLNGVLIGYRNTSFVPPFNNWTYFGDPGSVGEEDED